MPDIAIGQYYPADSILHKLDPRVKLVGTLDYIVCIFLVRGVAGYLFAAAVLAAFVALSRVPVRLIFKSLKPLWFILIVTALFNLFLTPGNLLAELWIFKITDAGIVAAVRLALRLILLVLGCCIMTLTTTPNQLTDGLEKLFSPLKVLHVPVHEIAMMMSIALRFIPILMEETDKIRKAQLARGADFDSGKFMQRIRGLIPILVPLFVSAFRRAGDLALAMESRCYHGGEGRTRMKPLNFLPRDHAAFAVLMAILAVSILFCIFGKGIL